MQTLIKRRHLPSQRQFNPPPAACSRVQPLGTTASHLSLCTRSRVPGSKPAQIPAARSETAQISAPRSKAQCLRVSVHLLHPTAIGLAHCGAGGAWQDPRSHTGHILPGKDALGCPLPCPGWEIDSCHLAGLCPHLPEQMNIHAFSDAAGPFCGFPCC